MLRKAVYLGMSLGALLTVIAIAFTAHAQSDPFGALYSPPGSATPAPSAKVGSTGVSTNAAASYAGAQTSGFASMAQLSMLPKVVAPLPVKVKEAGGKYLHRTKRVVVPTYSLALARSGTASGYAGGTGSDIVQRRTSVSTVLLGVSDELAAQLAEEAYQDLTKRLAAAGFEVLPLDQASADPDISRVTTYATPYKFNKDTLVYSPTSTPLRAWAPFTPPLAGPGASLAYGKATKTLDTIVISPGLLINYQNLESSGSHAYRGKASAGAEVHFSVGVGSGANLMVWPAPPYKGGWGSSMLVEKQQGTNEMFGIMYEVDDRSDNMAVHRAFAQLGSNMYRQSKYYAVEVDPNRYAALVRASFQGLNASIVAELVKKHNR